MVCTSRKLWLVLLACAVVARAAETDEATEAFNALYGKDLARVCGTGETRDDVELAVRLLAAAKRAADQPAFLTVLCEKAYDLALRHPTGYGTALAAMDLLARTVPDKAAACAARTFEIRQMQYDAARGDERKAAGEVLLDSLLPVIEAKEKAGDLAEAAALYRKAKTIAVAAGSPRTDEIDARAAALALRMKIAARIADVKALLARDPTNVSAREGLVRIYLVDLDDPAEAAKHLKGVQDKSLLKYVPAAAKGIEAPPELACLELGEWYRDLAARAPSHARAAMYARAKAYLERFLTIHTAKDLNRTRATLALEKVEEAVAKLTAPRIRPAKPTKPAPATTSKSAQISVNEPWPLALEVKSGQRLHITAEGWWRVLPRGQRRGPDDQRFYLRGRLGSGQPFRVGEDFTLAVKEDAVLYLGMREGGTYENNNGEIRVTVERTEAPEN